jgi:sugar lactone lactonase YvrE
VSEVRCVAPTGDVCGEGAVWAADEGRLYWTDINRFLVHSLDAADGSVRTWLFEEPAVAVALTDRPGVLLVALASRLVLFTPATGGREPWGPELPGWPAVRFNDGRPDPSGRLVIGTMGNNVGPAGEGLEVAPGLGRLYRLEAGRLVELRSGVGIANTVCWSPDLGTFYFADTMANRLDAHGYDPETGEIGAARPFLRDFPRGHPDGSAVDGEGYLWNCRYGGGCVVRVAPDGTVERVVEMPCGNITTCTFGGEGLGTLFITTAAAGRGPSERLAGSVFALDAPAPGLPERVLRVG